MKRILELNKVFVQEVLPLFFTKITLENSFLKSSGLSNDKYSIRLSNHLLKLGRPEYVPKSTRVLHFTSLRALQSILNEKALRLYNLNHANDPNEFGLLASQLDWEDELISSIKQHNYYISFCDKNILDSPNILNMWRHYGHNGYGCAIELEVDVTRYEQHTDAPIIFGQIDYQKIDLKPYVQAKNLFEEKMNVKVDDRGLLRGSFCLNKSEYFKTEEELRLIARCDYSANPLRSLDPSIPLQYDFDSANKPVPYFKAPFFLDAENYPKILVKAIHLGFQHIDPKGKEISEHLRDILQGLEIHHGWPTDIPIIKSPLGKLLN